ncbi:MAG: MarR family transcriptional regulator [Oscillospiraceae bacterium]|nr:MarR family transcriptional regulator [Oscillospiraceae bacterium]
MREKQAFAGLWAYNGEIKVNNELYRGLARSFGMAEAAFWVLYFLRMARDGLTLHDLCGCLYQSKQTVHSAVKQLEAEGALRAETGTDRRTRTFTLTPRGAQMAEATVDHVIDAEVRAMMEMDEAELAAFLRLFRQYNQALKREFGEKL